MKPFSPIPYARKFKITTLIVLSALCTSYVYLKYSLLCILICTSPVLTTHRHKHKQNVDFRLTEGRELYIYIYIIHSSCFINAFRLSRLKQKQLASDIKQNILMKKIPQLVKILKYSHYERQEAWFHLLFKVNHNQEIL